MNLEQRETVVAEALEPAFRMQLLARGQARSMIWHDGVLPRGAPSFVETLSYDLVAYGDALLLHAMNIRSEGGDEQLARRAFMQAGEAIEAVVTNGVPDDPQRGFLRMLSAALNKPPRCPTNRGHLRASIAADPVPNLVVPLWAVIAYFCAGLRIKHETDQSN